MKTATKAKPATTTAKRTPAATKPASNTPVNARILGTTIHARPGGAALVDEHDQPLTTGTMVTLVPDPSNAHDPNAISIRFGDRHIGWVPKEQAARIATDPGNARIWIAEVSEVFLLPTDADDVTVEASIDGAPISGVVAVADLARVQVHVVKTTTFRTGEKRTERIRCANATFDASRGVFAPGPVPAGFTVVVRAAGPVLTAVAA